MELLIVVMIVGVVYTLAISNFQKMEEKSNSLTLATLKEYLQGIPHERSVKFLCLDSCASCDIFVDDEKQKDLEGVFDGFLDNSIKVYRYEASFGVFEQEKEVYFNEEDVEEDVCFSYTVDKKGVGEQVFVEYKNSVYDFSQYLEKVTKFDSIEEAVKAKETLLDKVLK